MTAHATLPREAKALRLFRILPNGEPRSYAAVTFPRNPYQGCERTLRMALAVGWIQEDAEYADSYGVIDVLDEHDCIIFDWPVPDAHGFQALKKRLDTEVEYEEDFR